MAALTDRILTRFALREARAEAIHEKEHFRQCFIVCSLASKGDPQPVVTASYVMYGCHPEQLFERIAERRKAKLGSEYADWYDKNGNLNLDSIVPPKKPMHTVRKNGERRAA